MKKFVVFVVLLVVIGFAVIYKEDIHWQWAGFNDSAESYAGYLKAWPNGFFAAKAKELIEEREWEPLAFTSDAESLVRYVNKYPRGRHALEAKNRIERLRWAAARGAYTKKAFGEYLAKYPKGRFVNMANNILAGLDKALKQEVRYLEGHVQSLTGSNLVLKTSMGRTEKMIIPADAAVKRGNQRRSVAEIKKDEGVRISYVNTPDKTLLAREVFISYSVSHRSCGANCSCPLSRGCRVVKF